MTSSTLRAREAIELERDDVAPERPLAPGRTTLTARLAPVQRKASGGMPSGSRELDLTPRDPGGLPDELRANIEALAGIAMDDVRVSYNSSLPARMNAHAVASGRDIHLAPGQEQHLPHEAWHVVQQKQGRVAATVQAKGWQFNDDQALEHEADVMGARAMALTPDERTHQPARPVAAPTAAVHQLAALGPIEHIRNSCYIAAIIHTFAVTASLRNLLDPVANNLGGGPGGPGGPLAELQDLLHRAVNTVDAQALVDANWVAAIMTSMMALGVILDAGAQDVNAVTTQLVATLQNGAPNAAQPDGRPAYSLLVWQSEDIQDDIDAQGFLPHTLGNVVHLNRGPANQEDAPDTFATPDGAGGFVNYHLRSIVNRDVGSYDQSHFIAYANRGAMGAADEWHENDDVGPRARPIPSIDLVATDPAMLAARKEQLLARGVTDEDIEESPRLQQVLAPQPIDIRNDAVMYVYERATAAAVAAVDGGGRTLTGLHPPDASGFRLAYYQMLFAQRAQLPFDTRAALLAVLEESDGFEDDVATLRAEIVQGLADGLQSAIAQMLGLAKEAVSAPGVDSSADSDEEPASLDAAEQALIGAGAQLLSGPATKGRRNAYRASGDVGAQLAGRIRALATETDPVKVARFAPADLVLLSGWQRIPLDLGRGTHLVKGELRDAYDAFLRRLDGFLDDEVVEATLEPEARDRLFAIHTQLGADNHSGGGRKVVRSDATGIPAANDVTIDPGFQLFPPDSPAQSDLEDEPVDIGDQAARARAQGRFSVFAIPTFGNHNPQPLEGKGPISREQLTGLGHSNTAALVARGGQVVPRSTGPVLDPRANKNAHRHALGTLGAERDGYAEGTPHRRLDELAAAHQQRYQDNPTRPQHIFGQTDDERRTMRHILAGSLGWTEQSRLRPDEEAPELEQGRAELRKQLDDSTPAGRVAKRYRTATQKSLRHAESQALRTRLWQSLTQRVIALATAQPDGRGSVADRTLELYLNRSNCEGCAGRLIEEAIRFWRELDAASDEPTGTWQGARDRFRDDVRLVVGFSGNYHQDNLDLFQQLHDGLTDAGWDVHLLPRVRTTAEITKQTEATLGVLDRFVGAKGDQAERRRSHIQIDPRLRATTSSPFTNLFPPTASSSQDVCEDPAHDHGAHDHGDEHGADQQWQDGGQESHRKRQRTITDDQLPEDDFDVSLHLGPRPMSESDEARDDAPAQAPRDRFGLRGGRLRKPAPDEAEIPEDF